MKMKVQKRRPFRTALKILLAVVLILCALLLLWRPAGKMIYRDFYRIAEEGVRIPGLDEGLVPQGVWLEGDRMLVSGHTGDELAYVYTVEKDGQSRRCSLTKGQAPIKGHICGIAAAEDIVIVTAEDTVYAFSLQDVLAGPFAEALRAVSLDQHASFVTVDGDIYIGEFHYSPRYVCDHAYTDADGNESHAVLCRYDREAFLAAMADPEAPVPSPAAMYTLPDKVQGCALSGNTLVTVSSWGLSSSVYRVYTLPEVPEAEMNGVPLYVLDRNALVKTLEGPLMAEEMALADGSLTVMHESAASKYMIGRLLGYTRVFRLDWNALITH